MLARVGDISQHLNLSSTHSPLICLTPSLSRRNNKRQKGWTRVRKWIRRRWRREPRLQRAARSTSRSSTWASTISHLMVRSRTPSHYLEINPQTLTKVFSLAWMDHENLLMTSNPSKESVSSLEARMASVDLQPWWQGTHEEPKLRWHAQSLSIFRICSYFSKSLSCTS